MWKSTIFHGENSVIFFRQVISASIVSTESRSLTRRGRQESVPVRHWGDTLIGRKKGAGEMLPSGYD